jgi:hypothetical protein
MFSIEAQNLPSIGIISESGFIADKGESENIILGSVLLNDRWITNAEVLTINSETYLPKAINFNVKLETFVVKIAEDSLFRLDKSKVKSVQFDDKSFEILNDKYYENLSKGKLNVYKDYYLSINKGATDPISKAKLTEDKYVIKSKYYIQKEEILEELKISKKNILKLFVKEKASAVKKFIKKNSLSVKDNIELKQILEYYNSL